jgi:hypothetical protein
LEKEFLTQRRKAQSKAAKKSYLEPGRLCAFAPLREKSFLVSQQNLIIPTRRLQGVLQLSAENS